MSKFFGKVITSVNLVLLCSIFGVSVLAEEMVVSNETNTGTCQLQEVEKSFVLAPSSEAVSSVKFENVVVPKAGCFCSVGLQEAHGWGCGSSCSAAISACSADAYSKAEGNCSYGLCESNITHDPCKYNNPMCPGQFLTDCNLQYKCLDCMEQEWQ